MANTCSKNIRNGEKGKARKKNKKAKSLKTHQNIDLCACLSKNVIKHDASLRDNQWILITTLTSLQNMSPGYEK